MREPGEDKDEHGSSKYAGSGALFVNTYYFGNIWIYTELIPLLI